MAIQFVLGPAGSGKTEYVIKKLIEESMAHGDLNYLYVVPEQFSMEAQRDIVTMHPRHGTMNIDAIGFNRLAYRVFDEWLMNPEGFWRTLERACSSRRYLWSHRTASCLWKLYQQDGFYR